MADRQDTDLVPCSKCGAPVLPNLAECMFCGQSDPGKLASSSSVGRKYVETKQQLRRARQNAGERHATGRSNGGGGSSFQLPASIGQYRYLFEGDFAVTHTVVAASVLMYLLSLLIDVRGIAWFEGILGIMVPSGNAMLGLGATGRIPFANARLWTLFTAPYLHTGLFHIAISVFLLIQLGRNTERFYGSAPFFLIYTAAGVAGGALGTLFGGQLLPTPGAALFGMLAAMIVYGRSQHDSFGQQIVRQMMMFGVILLLFDLLGSLPGLLVDVGGALGGFAAATLFVNNPRYRYEPLVDRVARILAVMTVVFVGASLVVSFL